MIGETIINIPIYRCSYENFQEEIKVAKERLLKSYSNEILREIEEDGYDVSKMVDRQIESKWKCWQYNEIVGFLAIHILGDQIRGTLYYIKHKRIAKGIKNKEFIYIGKGLEMPTTFMKTNKEIFQRLLEILGALPKKRNRLKNRYIDLSEFKKIGRFIDWKELIKESN